MDNSTIKELEQLRDSYLSKANALTVTLEIVRGEYLKTPKQSEPTQIALFKPQEEVKDVNAATNIVLSAITKFGRLIRKSDIDKAVAHHKELTSDTVRYTITYLKKKGIIASIKVGKNNVNTFWGLVDWIDGDKPKKEFMYDEKSLVGKE